MKKKIVPVKFIEYCYECPELLHGFCLLLARHIKLYEAVEFPKDCPLDDVKLKDKSEGPDLSKIPETP